MKRSLLFAALASTAAAGCAGLVRDRLYQPQRAPLSAAALGPAVREIAVSTTDGLRLRGLAQAPVGDRPVLLFLHGNALGAADNMAWLAPVRARGYGVVAAEYRGYGGNPGAPTQTGLARDADAFYAWARTLAGSRPVWVVGHSLGAGVAFDLALRRRLDALITIGAFASVRDVAPAIARPFIPDPYDNRAAVAKLDEPLFLIHGDADATIPPWHAGELHRAASAAHAAGTAVVLVGADHRPDAETLAAVIDAIRPGAAGLAIDAAALPAAARLVPFAPEPPAR